MIRTTLLMLVLFATTLTTPVFASYPPQPLAVPAFFSIANKSD